jgi:hypothetical protein
MAETVDLFPSLRDELDEIRNDMTPEQRHVQLGICWAAYTAGNVTLSEFEHLRDLLGFTADDIDDLLY